MARLRRDKLTTSVSVTLLVRSLLLCVPFESYLICGFAIWYGLSCDVLVLLLWQAQTLSNLGGGPPVGPALLYHPPPHTHRGHWAQAKIRGKAVRCLEM